MLTTYMHAESPVAMSCPRESRGVLNRLAIPETLENPGRFTMADFIVPFYNQVRRYSSIDDLTPNDFKDLQVTKTQTRLT